MKTTLATGFFVQNKIERVNVFDFRIILRGNNVVPKLISEHSSPYIKRHSKRFSENLQCKAKTILYAKTENGIYIYIVNFIFTSLNIGKRSNTSKQLTHTFLLETFHQEYMQYVVICMWILLKTKI